jgi:hypothetical protein
MDGEFRYIKKGCSLGAEDHGAPLTPGTRSFLKSEDKVKGAYSVFVVPHSAQYVRRHVAI